MFVKHLVFSYKLLGFRIPIYGGPVPGKELDNLINVDPDFPVSLPLGFVEDKLHPKVKMGDGHPVDVFGGAVAGHPQIPDDIPAPDQVAGL